ncbi:endolytic transglycosylase MltG [Fusobacterium sp. PH5-44]|uniref:endolytic transglycosylase MltG n=1 Tax=unclassified Fusobacterium TaxID=2648384 RepID=UPI003D21478F
MKKMVYFVFLVVIGVGGYTCYEIFRPREYKGIVEIKSNVSLRESMSKLEISKEIPFRLYLKYIRNGGKDIKAGYYSLNNRMNAIELIDVLEKGKEKAYKVTVPEGYTIAQIIAIFEKDGKIDKDKFYAELKNINDFPYKTPEGNFEGYFYPETYYIPEYANEKMIINIFLNEFLRRFPPDKYTDKEEFYKKLVMASILEREAKVNDEKPIMASVFYNRLKINMVLASDATVNYIYNYEKRRMLYKDLEVKSPYNTYKNKGLPPAPICNPTTISVSAAYNPADTDYLFFVATGEGGRHFFSKKYQEHLEFQRKNNKK